MHISKKIFTLPAVLLLLSSASGCAPRTVALVPSPVQTITVTGQGEATAAPDLGTVRLGVEERADTAEAAMAQANTRMAAILQAVKAEGVSPADTQTADLSVFYERYPENPYPVPVAVPVEMQPAAPSAKRTKEMAVTTAAPAPVVAQPRGQYVVRNTVIVSVRKLDTMGDVIGAAMQAGANHLYGLELSIDDPAPLAVTARTKAIEHARAKAEQLAKQTGNELGAVVTIVEQDGAPMPVPMSRAMSMKEASVPVERGQMSITQTVQVVYSLAE